MAYSSPSKRRNSSQAPDTGTAQLLAKDGALPQLKAMMAAGDLTLADLDAPDARGDTALLYGVFNNKPAVWQWLIEQGVNIGHANANGDTALHHIAGRFSSGENALGDLEKLIAAGARVNAVNRRGETPALREARRGSIGDDPKQPRDAHIKALIRAGADVSHVSDDGFDLSDYMGPVVFEWLAEHRSAKTSKILPAKETGEPLRSRVRSRP